MPTYIMLGNWTDQGVRAIADSARRVDAAKKLLTEMGGNWKSFFMTMGAHDVVVVFEAPDDAVAVRFALKLGQAGSLRTSTLKAFPEQAYREVIASLG
jgi:uncharacterized protein with GYD domain